MKSKDCLTEQELIFFYYGESLNNEKALTDHLTDCESCQQRLANLSKDLGRLPPLDCQADDHAGTRLAARLQERLSRSRPNFWLPAAGISIVAGLLIFLNVSSPPPSVSPQISAQMPGTEYGLDVTVDPPEIEFLEHLELLHELDVLAQLEGV